MLTTRHCPSVGPRTPVTQVTRVALDPETLRTVSPTSSEVRHKVTLLPFVYWAQGQCSPPAQPGHVTDTLSPRCHPARRDQEVTQSAFHEVRQAPAQSTHSREGRRQRGLQAERPRGPEARPAPQCSLGGLSPTGPPGGATVALSWDTQTCPVKSHWSSGSVCVWGGRGAREGGVPGGRGSREGGVPGREGCQEGGFPGGRGAGREGCPPCPSSCTPALGQDCLAGVASGLDLLPCLPQPHGFNPGT